MIAVGKKAEAFVKGGPAQQRCSAEAVGKGRAVSVQVYGVKSVKASPVGGSEICEDQDGSGAASSIVHRSIGDVAAAANAKQHGNLNCGDYILKSVKQNATMPFKVVMPEAAKQA